MPNEYEVKRKLQEQSGSYFVVLPKIWVQSLRLRQGDNMRVTFNGIVKVKPLEETEASSCQTETGTSGVLNCKN